MKPKRLGRKTLLVHYVNVSHNPSRATDELDKYRKFVESQIEFRDVANLYIPQCDEPTHIERLIN